MTFLDWKQTHFDRLVFAYIDTLLPALQFTRNQRGYWQSPYKLDGSQPKHPRKDKTVITDKNPAFALEQGGQSMLLTDLYAQLNNIDRATAMATMAKAVGLELPTGSTHTDTMATMASIEGLQRLTDTMASRLANSPQSKQYQYLQQRGYTTEYIEYLTNVARVGIIDTDTASQLRELLKDSDTPVNKGIGTTHTLAIPYLSNGRVIGFAFRIIDTDTAPKYLYAWAKGYSNNTAFYGLKPWGYSANAKGLKALTVVEGQLDAIAAGFHGITNVVAAGGLNLGAKALQAAKARNIDTIILLLDNDQAGQSLDNIERAAKAIANEGLRCLVSSLPLVVGANKIDLDTYLNQQQGNPQTILQAIDQTHPAPLHLYTAYRCKAIGAGETEAGYTTLEGLKNELLRLSTQPYTKPTDLGLLVTALNTWTGGAYSIEGLRQEQAASIEQASKQQAAKSLANLLSSGLSMANSGNALGAIEAVTKGINDLKPATQAATFAGMIAPPSIEGLRAKLQATPTGLPTCYTLTNTDSSPAPLVLPVGLSIVAGKASHGKSRMLLNLAMDQVKRGGAKVLYLTFEETHTALTLQIANLLHGQHFSNNNYRTLENYYYKGTTQYFWQGTFEAYQQSERTALELQTSGRLCVVDSETIGTSDTATICELLRYTAKTEGLKAVFIDYASYLRIDHNPPPTRTLELGLIARLLQATANALGIPIVLATQLNRETPSPVDMTGKDLADSVELERNANTVLMLWNSSQELLKSNTYYTAKGEPTQAAQNIEALGFTPNQAGRLYVKAVKCRGAAPKAHTVLMFDGNTGRIEQHQIDTLHQPTDTDTMASPLDTVNKAKEVPF